MIVIYNQWVFFLSVVVFLSFLFIFLSFFLSFLICQVRFEYSTYGIAKVYVMYWTDKSTIVWMGVGRLKYYGIRYLCKWYVEL